MQDRFPEAHAHVARLVTECQLVLARTGVTISTTGVLHDATLHTALHSLACAKNGEAQTENQDYAIAWRNSQERSPGEPRLIVVIADGLTSSYAAEWASRLACWTAARSLVETRRSPLPPSVVACNALSAAASALGCIADQLAEDPAVSLPQDYFLSTWKYVLRKGYLLQTTITMAWVTDEQLYVASIGDAEIACRQLVGSGEPLVKTEDRCIMKCDLSTSSVHALGPTKRSLEYIDLDCWRQQELARDTDYLYLFYTDGVARAHMGEYPELLDFLQSSHFHQINEAKRCLQSFAARSPGFYQDDITLATLRVDATIK